MEKLIGVKEALELSREKVRELHREYLNAGLCQLLRLLDFDKRFVKAEGAKLWDEEGKMYWDFLGSFGAMNVGHNHPKVLAALDLVRGFPTMVQTTLSPLAGALARNLCRLAPGGMKRAFFCNSGAEAVEGALKLARAATGRPGFIYCHNSFHGKTFGALSVTGRKKYQEPFLPLLPNCQAIPYDDLAALEEALRKKEAAAFIVEPIQGEGGIIVPSPGYLREAKRLCSRYGTLLIVDEIQTGLGRTGKLFACEHDGVEPDIICLAKSLGGGVMPIGAFLTTDAIWNKAYGSPDRAQLHTSTFGGNAWACAAALATLEVILEEDLPRQAARKGELFLARLRELQARYPHLIKEVRGKGLLVGVEFAEKQKGVLSRLTFGWVDRLAEEFLGSLVAGQLLNRFRILTAYTLNNPNVIRLEPPLVVEEEGLLQVTEALEKILKENRSFLGLATKTFLAKGGKEE
ncbi:aspartate aminotransferase family protein [Ammonifex thiophilus]|uniref:Aspartate aminotransferase family protein n=1 Tax=Ammonifex thiophilus TaxID=444093 RepID=A0A3D8P170_9THEO|nr:aspartate aminotransferase family protein [Ammonifex thiophilus]RDV81149.1 aspartate aminotransferase family protein [Ammonifex thiophilus]